MYELTLIRSEQKSGNLSGFQIMCVCVCMQGNLLQVFKIVGLPKPLLFFWDLGWNYEGDAQYWALSWDRDCSAVEGLSLLLSFPRYDGLFMVSCSLEAM